MDEKELILLKEVQKYSERNDKLEEKLERMKQRLEMMKHNYSELSKVSYNMSRSIHFMKGSHSESISKIASNLHESYLEVIARIKQRHFDFTNRTHEKSS